MKKTELQSLLSGELLDDEVILSLAELCRVCELPARQVVELVEYGVIEPVGSDPQRWQFHGVSIRRVRCAIHLQRDLGVNTAGAALALDLLEEMSRLRRRLRRFEEQA